MPTTQPPFLSQSKKGSVYLASLEHDPALSSNEYKTPKQMDPNEFRSTSAVVEE